MIAFLTGSGFYGREGFEPTSVATRFGEVTVLTGEIAGKPVLLLPRHGAAHRYLPHQIPHRGNLLALKEAGATAVVSCTVCGVIRPEWGIGEPMVASDLWFPENRLGDGSACTIFMEPGEEGRGHAIAESFFHSALTEDVRRLLERTAGVCRTGCYAHGHGPRFNSKAEIRAMRAGGADFVSQTCGPEAVLANELELPYALAAFGTDFANGVSETPTPVEELQALMARSKDVFGRLMEALVAEEGDYRFENVVFRFS
mgnify:CR=1 FL=1